MESKTNCIIIHGCPSSSQTLIDMSERTYYKHWIPWTRGKLIEKGLKTDVPLMPEPWEPMYEKFKIEFEKCEINENTVLVGHSCGCAFLVQWLGDTKKKVKKLILVAPWKIAKEKNLVREKFYNFQIDSEIKSRVGDIVMFTSDNDRQGGPESIDIYHKALGGRVITLPNQGHFILEDMRTVEFPELLKVILE